MKIGIIQERKTPPDYRVPLTPQHCAELKKTHPEIEVVVEESPKRSYTHAEYEAAGIPVVKDVSDCDVLLGVKEVPMSHLIDGKTYFFFSHTIKKQPYNRELLRTVLAKKIQLVDYEALTWTNGVRILGFGRYAGLVGAYNGLLTWGKKYNLFNLKPAHECHDLKELLEQLDAIKLPKMKILVTGNGRVARGSMEILNHMGVKEVTPDQFLANSYDEAVFTQTDSDEYYARIDGTPFQRDHFYKNPEMYKSTFAPYAKVADLMINAIYWHSKVPRFFTLDEMASADFNIKVIADITCDIDGSVPSTTRATTIADPIYGWDAAAKKEVEPFGDNTIDMMTVDNLPCELPRDASYEFSENMLKYVLPHLLAGSNDDVIERASLTNKNGELTEHFKYLTDYVS